MADDAGPTRRVVCGTVAPRPAVLAAALFAAGIVAHPVLPRLPVLWLVALATVLLAAWRWVDRPRLGGGLLGAGLALSGLLAGQLSAFYYPRHHVSAFASDDPRLAQ